MSALRIGSLFSGYGGLDEGVRRSVGGEVAWHCEVEPAAVRLLEHHWPDVPNLGDITQVEWADVEPVDVLTGGFPCQDVSAASKRAGLRPDSRSGLWTHMARAINVLRPELVVIENVRGLLSADAHCDLEPCPWCLGDNEGRPLRALGAVLGDLAVLGYDAQWHGLRAADAGAAHGRYRVFIVARPAGANASERGRGTEGRDDGLRLAGLVAGAAADAGGGELQRRRVGGVVEGAPGQGEGEGPERQRDRHSSRDGGAVAADSSNVGHERCGRARHGWTGPANGGESAADTASVGRGEGRAKPAGLVGRPDVAVSGSHAVADAVRNGREGRPERNGGQEGGQPAPRRIDAAGRVLDWGDYGPAIKRWEDVLGRSAPAPTQQGARGGQQLSPAFVEWLMGLDAGHVTGVPGLSRNEQLKLLGNGVVPQQAELALRTLLAADRQVVAA